jgi:hypothetical protein
MIHLDSEVIEMVEFSDTGSLSVISAWLPTALLASDWASRWRL